MRLKTGMTVCELTEELNKAGVIGAGRVGSAVDIIAEMFKDPDFTTFITLSGSLVPSGMRLIFRDLLRDDYIDAVVTNGANVIHDLVEAIGRYHFVGNIDIDDRELFKQGINRAYDIFIESDTFIQLEKFICDILDTIPKNQRTGFAYHEFLKEIGLRLEDEESILYTAARKNIPIFSPGFLDSMLGIPLWMYSKRKKLSFNPLKDFDLMADIVFDAKKSGAIILGGGVPKHHTQYIHTLREGLDAAIQISTARPENGSLSGAPLKESITWGKLKGDNQQYSTIFGDVTILFPLIVAAALEKIKH
jgi:deoxyhypusine synthase